jgi:hypothetical protein
MLDGFNEIHTFVASFVLGRVPREDWTAAIASPTPFAATAGSAGSSPRPQA